ncbi:AUGMIN subunit 4-like [Ipomoea triloba]|uniref:AUGMIN subunit 4-like n=1 Tax=Ipomoea triloba TaxID=35885 RepID=UPI00125DF963|nr:AUGMIN subunit 4-like [Ipomoea triloba]
MWETVRGLVWLSWGKNGANNYRVLMVFALYHCSPKLRIIAAEAAQRWRLPLISIDGEIQDDEIEKLSVLSRSSLDNTSTSVTMSSNSNSANFANVLQTLQLEVFPINTLE